MPKKKTKTIAKKVSKSKPAAKPAAKEETMDRKALKAVVAQLKEAGSDVKALKSDSDEALQKKVNEALAKLPSAEVLTRLESVSPDKLVSVLKRDCLGIFVDLSDVSCVRCRDNQACVSAFIKNLKGGFRDLQPAMEAKYDPDALVFVVGVDNPNPAGDDYHDTFQAILDEVPGTMSELREIVERDFEVGSDADFMKWVDGLRNPKKKSEAIIKLVADLTEANKKELRKAGVEV